MYGSMSFNELSSDTTVIDSKDAKVINSLRVIVSKLREEEERRERLNKRKKSSSGDSNHSEDD
jgi:hypothetical protein